jgi:hypothetical protein
MLSQRVANQANLYRPVPLRLPTYDHDLRYLELIMCQRSGSNVSTPSTDAALPADRGDHQASDPVWTVPAEHPYPYFSASSSPAAVQARSSGTLDVAHKPPDLLRLERVAPPLVGDATGIRSCWFRSGIVHVHDARVPNACRRARHVHVHKRIPVVAPVIED